jgi:hypothetical protein
MAGTFGANPQVAGQVSGELAGIRSEMQGLGKIFDGYRGATGSKRVEGALNDFYEDSSDSREKLDKLLERASGLLRGLSEGTIAVDNGLADSLEPEGGQPAQPGPGRTVAPA